MDHFERSESGGWWAHAVGPAAVAAMAGILVGLDVFTGFLIPNPAVWFLLALVVVGLTGSVAGVVLSNVVALVATLWLLGRLELISDSGRGFVMLVSIVIAFPVASGVVVVLRRRLTAAVEAPVKAEHMLFEAVMASMHDAIVETDWKGIRSVNPSFCQMTGFSREELIGARAPYPFWPAEKYAEIAAALEKSMRGRALDFELVLTRKNGERFSVLLSVSRIIDGAGAAGANRVLYSFRDITELKKAQAAAEAATEARAEFLRLLSEELRNPVKAILTEAGRLEQSERLSADARAAIEGIRVSAEKEARLIDGILEQARRTAVTIGDRAQKGRDGKGGN